VNKREQVFVQVVAGLILLGLGWLFGLAKPLLLGLGARVTLPVWVLILAAILIVASVFLLARRTFAKSVDLPAPPPISTDLIPDSLPQPPPLGELEIKILEVLARSHSELWDVGEIAGVVESKDILAQQAVDRLSDRGYLDDNYNSRLGRRYMLSRKGRDTAIELGLVK